MEKETVYIEPKKVLDNNLKLIYVNPVGETHSGSQLLEFIFSDNPDDAIGIGWEDICDLGVQPPKKNFIKHVLKVDSKKIVFSTVVESFEFRMLDAVFGVVGLAWEFIEDYKKMSSLNKSLIVFKFNDTLEDVKAKLEQNKIDYE